MAFPVEQKYIERAERELGFSLPQKYVSRLRRENGGEVEVAGETWQLHPIFDDTDRKHISRTANHIIRETEVARKWRGFPAEAISVATNGSGDHLVLLPERDRFGNIVYFWDHETSKLEPVGPWDF